MSETKNLKARSGATCGVVLATFSNLSEAFAYANRRHEALKAATKEGA